MSTKHVRNAADLVRFKAGLKVECLGCGHVLELAGFELFREIGSLSLADLKPRLKCSRCQKKDVRICILTPPRR
jgi:hypothetical protein